jgi:type II secretory pathway predicted ATPase ExeA
VYYDYFGLSQPPFRITPDTSLFFPGGNRGAILNAMIYAITSGEGIVKVVGEVGSGKTMLCRMMALELPENVEVVYLANPSLSPDHILHAIAIELKLPVNAHDDRLRVMQSLQQYLLKRHSENRQVVLFIEEAQSMPVATLEEIRLLSNLETHQHKLLQIVLFGQPELDQMISQKIIRQLKERITYSFYLNPLNNNEIRDYLNTRLRASGYRGNDIFTSSAIREIARFSKGLLRRINILADKSLLAAYAANQHNISAKQVRLAARDSEFVAGWQHFRFSVLVAGVIIIMLFAAWLVSIYYPLDGLNIWKTAATEAVETGTDPAHQPHETGGKPVQEKPAATVETIYHAQHDLVFSGGRKGTEYQAGELPENRVTIKGAEIDMPAGADQADQQDSANPVIPENDNMPSSKTGQDAGLAGNLLEDEQYAKLIEWGELSLSDDEVELLIDQLRLWPPESVYFSGADTVCNLCTSIIYRPLIDQKSL